MPQATYTPIRMLYSPWKPVLSSVLNGPHGMSKTGGILGFSQRMRRLEARCWHNPTGVNRIPLNREARVHSLYICDVHSVRAGVSQSIDIAYGILVGVPNRRRCPRAESRSFTQVFASHFGHLCTTALNYLQCSVRGAGAANNTWRTPHEDYSLRSRGNNSLTTIGVAGSPISAGGRDLAQRFIDGRRSRY